MTGQFTWQSVNENNRFLRLQYFIFDLLNHLMPACKHLHFAVFS